MPVFRRGKLIYRLPSLNEIRQRVQKQLAMFHGGINRFVSPHQYPVGLEIGLHNVKTDIILKLRSKAEKSYE